MQGSCGQEPINHGQGCLGLGSEAAPTVGYGGIDGENAAIKAQNEIGLKPSLEFHLAGNVFQGCDSLPYLAEREHTQVVQFFICCRDPLVTFGSGLRRTNSEMMLVSSRNPLTDQHPCRSPACDPDRG